MTHADNILSIECGLGPGGPASKTSLFASGLSSGGRQRTQRVKPSILIVDDEEAVGLGMSEILKDEGFEAAYALNGKDAVEAMNAKSYSLVFMDMIMPGMNGLEAYREIKRIRPQTRVILFTGFFKDAEEVIMQGIKEGMIDEFIRKPYFADEIIRSARKYA
ncbi:MAG: response regulator [Deltaproteobacteria bacterium]|nr:response regulator [Deltaproteobacteria bacterium]